jgi:hypothetical protein
MDLPNFWVKLPHLGRIYPRMGNVASDFTFRKHMIKQRHGMGDITGTIEPI